MRVELTEWHKKYGFGITINDIGDIYYPYSPLEWYFSSEPIFNKWFIEKNIKHKVFFSIADSKMNGHSDHLYFDFDNNDDALMFKLTWC